MVAVFNQYSFVFLSIFAGLILAAALWRWRRPPAALRAGLMALYIGGMVGLHFASRYADTFDGSLASADAILTDGNPTLLMLYSNY
jgi:hypothetical protein